MVRSSKYLLFLILGLYLVGCSSTKELPTKTIFEFQYDRENYEIISINSQDGEGINYLQRPENSHPALKCLDLDQDGFIDILQFGSLSLDEVNVIYQYGIQQAIDAGKFRSNEGTRIYNVVENDSLFVIHTFGSSGAQLYNKFSITDLSKNMQETYWDSNADGTLDQEESSSEWQKVQAEYIKRLQQGINENQIQFIEGKYVVSFVKHPPAS